MITLQLYYKSQFLIVEKETRLLTFTAINIYIKNVNVRENYIIFLRNFEVIVSVMYV